MATDAQIAANQLNAQKSTGPQSTTGKQASSMNAVTHGIFATNPIATGENKAEFNELSEAIRDYYKPSDIIEEALVHNIIIALWRQQRARCAEAAIINLSMTRRSITSDTNTFLKVYSYNSFSEEDIFDDHSSLYQHLLLLKKELDSIDFDKVSTYPSTIKGNAPLTYDHLPEMAEKYKMEWDQFMERPRTIEKALEELRSEVEKQLGLIKARKNAYDTAQLIRQTKAVPNEENARLIMTYEARADNAYAKAVEALRKHRLDKQKVIDAEIIPSQ